MIQKYLNESVLLISEVPFEERDRYNFVWTIDGSVELSGHTTEHSFNELGIHNIKLVATDKVTNIATSFEYDLNIIQKQKNYAEENITDLGFGLGDFGNTSV